MFVEITFKEGIHIEAAEMKVEGGRPICAQLDVAIHPQVGALKFGMPGHMQIRTVRDTVEEIAAEHFPVQGHTSQAYIGFDLRLTGRARCLRRKIELAGDGDTRMPQRRK